MRHSGQTIVWAVFGHHSVKSGLELFVGFRRGFFAFCVHSPVQLGVGAFGGSQAHSPGNFFDRDGCLLAQPGGQGQFFRVVLGPESLKSGANSVFMRQIWQLFAFSSIPDPPHRKQGQCQRLTGSAPK